LTEQKVRSAIDCIVRHGKPGSAASGPADILFLFDAGHRFADARPFAVGIASVHAMFAIEFSGLMVLEGKESHR